MHATHHAAHSGQLGYYLGVIVFQMPVFTRKTYQAKIVYIKTKAQN